MFISLFKIVYAKSDYYENNFGVKFTKDEYNFISKMFYVGYQSTVTEEEYKMIFENYDKESKIEKKTINNNEEINLLGNFHSTSSKSITISKSCDTTCLISVVANWSKSPNVRSYDLIGAYLDDTTLTTTPVTKVINSTGINMNGDIKKEKAGFGVSIQLIKNGDDMRITQSFRVNNNGHIYASYQHAKKAITLTNSKKYTISRYGYGDVFLFDSLNIQNYYDGMEGVDIAL